jgi:GDPmannose 4,6-dehydratase
MSSERAASPLRVLVTGATGQDGGYLVEQLVAAGHDVHGTVGGPVDGEELPAHLAALGQAVTLHAIDLHAPETLTRVVDEVAPDRVFNLAGASSVAASWKDPVGTFDINARAVLALLEHLLRRQEDEGHAVRVVQASSAEVFADAGEGTISETSRVAPVNPYGVAKAAAHQAVGMYRRRGLHASSVILFNHESPRRPPQFVTRKITQAAVAIAEGRQDGLVLGDLDVRRDWGWAPDYVDAMARVAAADETGDYVVATGTAHSLRDFVATAFAAVGLPDWERYVSVDAEFVRPADAPVLVGDSGKARRVLGWRTTKSFEEIVGAMVQADRDAST